MPGTIISDSANIALLDSKITADMFAGVFTVDITPSVFIGTGNQNVLGVSVKIENVSNGTVTKDFPLTGYDITTPFSAAVSVNIPTIAGTYQYGKYLFTVQLTDQGGKVYEVIKPVSICAPDSKNRKYGSLSAQLNGSCRTGKLYVIADAVPVYGGVISDSQTNVFTLEYPTHSTLPVLNATVTNFSVVLFEGVYLFAGTSNAHYNLGDNVFAQVKYQYKREKDIRCALDEECIAARLRQLVDQLDTDCSAKEKKETQDTIIHALLLVKAIETTISSGFDASNYIAELETVLGCVCTCNCSEGTPVNPGTVGNDVVINGCGIQIEVNGLTTTYTINNYDYIIEVAENGGALIIDAPVLTDCTKRQTIRLDITKVYSQIKGQVNSDTEYNFWASIISKSWDGFDVTCLGLTPAQWSAMTFKQRSSALFAGVCAGGICNAVISGDITSNSGSSVNIGWVNKSGVYENAVYIDDILVGTVLATSSLGGFIAPEFADGIKHTYKIVSKCQNGSIGNSLSGDFTYFGCPTIAPPIVTQNNITASCPYNLTALVGTLPAGISAEWHNQNNTNASSLVANPSQAADGTYYVFAKNTSGCYSLGVQVILVCATGNCTAPQNLIAESITGGTRIRFSSASYPPPANSYTVKRRLASQSDAPASYTTIGNPTWNASAGKWEILDSAATANHLYVYRAISNCGSTAPYIDYSFANISCPAITASVVSA